MELSYGQTMLLKDLFAKEYDNKLEIDGCFKKFTDKYYLMGFTPGSFYKIESTKIDSMFFGNVLYKEKGEELISDHFFIFLQKKQELHLFFSYPKDFINNRTNIEAISIVKIYNLNGEVKHELVMPYFMPNKCNFSNFYRENNSLYKTGVTDNIDSNKEGKTLANHSLLEYLKLLDSMLQLSNTQKAKKLDANFQLNKLKVISN